MSQSSTIIKIGLLNRHIETGADLCTPGEFTTTLENAISRLPNGGLIEILDGIFYVDRPIQLSSNLIIKGVGSGTVLRVNDNHPVFTLSTQNDAYLQNAQVRDLQVQINNDRYDKEIISVHSGNGSTKAYLQNNRFSNLKIDYLQSPSKVALINLITEKNAFIQDNTFSNFEVQFDQSPKANYITLSSLGKIRDNDFLDFHVLRKGGFSNDLIEGIGLWLETGNQKAFILNNSFENIKLPPIATGIKVALGSAVRSNVNESWINNNRFIDIYLEGYVIGIDFYKAVNLEKYDFARNLFRDIILQTKSYSEIGINNVFGKANTFLHCNIYDWKRKNAAVAKKLYVISEDASYTYVSNPRIFKEYIYDRGEFTTWETNSMYINRQSISNFSKTAQLQLFEAKQDINPISAPKHVAKISAKSGGDGQNEMLFFTLDKNDDFSKKMVIDSKGDVNIHKKLTVNDLPLVESGQIIVHQDGTLSRIKNQTLKQQLGISSIQKDLDHFDLRQSEQNKMLLEQIALLQAQINSLEQQLNAN